MAIIYRDLDEKTRKLMITEVNSDIQSGSLYLSTRFNDLGRAGYADLLQQAITEHDEDWLAEQIRENNFLNTHEPGRSNSGYRKVPSNAAIMFAESEFNRFYVRALCQRAIEEGSDHLVVYRGKEVSQPRPESQQMIGKKINPQSLLDDLRSSQGVEPALGLPPGPNSGLTVHLP